MTQKIVRMYADRDVAMEAVRAVVREGFSRYDVHVVSPPDLQQGEPDSERLEGIAAMIHRGDIAREKAAIYALAVNKGGTMVVVEALFGTATLITRTLDRFPTIDTGYVEPVKPKRVLDRASPFSSFLGLPVLSHNPAPFSQMMNLGIGEVKSATPFSTWLKWPTLSGSATPFSSYLGMKTLSDEPAPFSKWLSWGTLSGSAAPFSSWLKWPTLSGSASPFSKMLNMPTLSNNPAPFSSLFKWPLLSRRLPTIKED
jgi:hypothetical protein